MVAELSSEDSVDRRKFSEQVANMRTALRGLYSLSTQCTQSLVHPAKTAIGHLVALHQHTWPGPQPGQPATVW
eukprot:2972526-Rhodomonas_salina.1